MATLVTDNFDGYSDGDLTCNGNWSGSTQYDVQGTVVQAGSKAVKLNSTLLLYEITNTAPADVPTGTQTFYIRSDTVVDNSLDSNFQDSAGDGLFLVFFRADAITLQCFGGNHAIITGAVADTC